MRLKEQDVVTIFLSPNSTRALADQFGVSTHTIRGIKRRKYHADLTGQLQLFPGKASSNRHILTDNEVLFIYRFEGSLKMLKQITGVSKKVAMNIKFRQTYTKVTEDERAPGELRLYKLTWNDVCAVRGSSLTSQLLSEMFFVSLSTINNIKAGRTRTLK